MKSIEMIRNLYKYNIWANAEFMRYFERLAKMSFQNKGVERRLVKQRRMPIGQRAGGDRFR